MPKVKEKERKARARAKAKASRAPVAERPAFRAERLEAQPIEEVSTAIGSTVNAFQR